MARQKLPVPDAHRDELILTIHNELPIPVDGLAQLLSDLARDYSKMTRGRELIVAELSSGSLWIILRDAMEAIGGTNTLITFGKSVASFVKMALGKGTPARAMFRGRKKPGVATALSLAKLATRSRSKVELTYKGTDGESLLLTVTPLEALRVEEANRAARDEEAVRRAVAEVEQRTAQTIAPLLLASGNGSMGDLASALTRLVRGAIAAEHGQGSDVPSERDKALLVAFANALIRHGMAHVVMKIAADLDADGYAGAAELLRDLPNHRY